MDEEDSESRFHTFRHKCNTYSCEFGIARDIVVCIEQTDVTQNMPNSLQ